jgi:Fe-S-cluster containining protein
MSGTHDNPCKVCTINQDCCTRLSGLMLTRDEYDRHFRNHRDELVTRPVNGFFIISSGKGGACPHWENSGCRIYHVRPVDCRLYPYVIRHLIKRNQSVKIVFHAGSICLKKNPLYQLMPETEARALVMAFGKKVFGENTAIVVQREKGPFSRLRNRIEAALSRRLNKTRHY